MFTQKISEAHTVAQGAGTGRFSHSLVRMVDVELLGEPSFAAATHASQSKIAVLGGLKRRRRSKPHPLVEASNLIQCCPADEQGRACARAQIPSRDQSPASGWATVTQLPVRFHPGRCNRGSRKPGADRTIAPPAAKDRPDTSNRRRESRGCARMPDRFPGCAPATSPLATEHGCIGRNVSESSSSFFTRSSAFWSTMISSRLVRL